MDFNRKCFQCGAPMQAGQQICPRCCTDQKRAGNVRAAAPAALKVSSFVQPLPFTLTPVVPCAACNPGLNLLGSFRSDGPRSKIAVTILTVLQRQGSYSPGGLVSFWQGHREHLCPECQSKLDDINSIKQKALALLEEAVRLDPKNEPAKRNLAALRSML